MTRTPAGNAKLFKEQYDLRKSRGQVWMGSDHATDAQYVGVIDHAAECANYGALVYFYRKTHGNP